MMHIAVKKEVQKKDELLKQQVVNSFSASFLGNGILFPKLFWPTVRKKML